MGHFSNILSAVVVVLLLLLGLTSLPLHGGNSVVASPPDGVEDRDPGMKRVNLSPDNDEEGEDGDKEDGTYNAYAGEFDAYDEEYDEEGENDDDDNYLDDDGEEEEEEELDEEEPNVKLVLDNEENTQEVDTTCSADRGAKCDAPESAATEIPADNDGFTEEEEDDGMEHTELSESGYDEEEEEGEGYDEEDDAYEEDVDEDEEQEEENEDEEENTPTNKRELRDGDDATPDYLRTQYEELPDGTRRLKCVDRDKRCPRYPKEECEKNVGWMVVHCASYCGRCELLNATVRCNPKTIGKEFNDALGPGDVGRIMRGLGERFPFNTQYLSTDPYIAVIRNFVTRTEIAAVLAETVQHMQRSTDQGEYSEDGLQEQVISSGRTSYNAWCDDRCESNPVVATLIERISEALQMENANFESFQVLRYRKGQKYDRHHDSSEEDNENLSGPRVFTFFLYLSEVEEGGETAFTDLNITVRPEAGAVLVWPSVLDSDPTKVDMRMHHAALPVKKGVKFAANVWAHLRDFRTANIWGGLFPRERVRWCEGD